MREVDFPCRRLPYTLSIPAAIYHYSSTLLETAQEPWNGGVLLWKSLLVEYHYGLATLTPARPDRNGNGPVPAYFFSVLQSGFLAHACSMPACLHQNFEGNLKER